jgi:hypothetical protein
MWDGRAEVAQAVDRRQPHREGAAKQAAENGVKETEGGLRQHRGGEGAKAPRQVA